ncbi:hypothetical protein BRC92_06790, partial [Halobacteriales archaeon QS_4_69_31]
KPIGSARGEVGLAAERFRRAAAEVRDRTGEYREGSTEGHEGWQALIKHEPMGTVLCIGPYNYPLSTVAYQVAPALAAGNSVVLKPSSKTPISSARLTGIVDDAVDLPDGALNYVPGRGSGSSSRATVRGARPTANTTTRPGPARRRSSSARVRGASATARPRSNPTPGRGSGRPASARPPASGSRRTTGRRSPPCSARRPRTFRARGSTRRPSSRPTATCPPGRPTRWASARRRSWPPRRSRRSATRARPAPSWDWPRPAGRGGAGGRPGTVLRRVPAPPRGRHRRRTRRRGRVRQRPVLAADPPTAPPAGRRPLSGLWRAEPPAVRGLSRLRRPLRGVRVGHAPGDRHRQGRDHHRPGRRTPGVRRTAGPERPLRQRHRRVRRPQRRQDRQPPRPDAGRR